MKRFMNKNENNTKHSTTGSTDRYETAICIAYNRQEAFTCICTVAVRMGSTTMHKCNLFCCREAGIAFLVTAIKSFSALYIGL